MNSDSQLTPQSTNRKILIIGIAGGLAQITARLILENYPDVEIIGIDARNTERIRVHRLQCRTFKYSRGNFENLFREHHFDIVFHLARITHTDNDQISIAKRLDINLMGTSRILDLSLQSHVKKVIVLSTFHVYGALPENSIFLTEDQPLQASINHPELRDVVEMDQIATNWMWKYQNELSTIVLRPCNIIGTQIANTMTKFLRSSMAIRPIDYNPQFQFIHEFDMAQILMHSMDGLPTGIYNVATDEFISLQEALDIIGRGGGISFPIFLGPIINKALKVFNREIPPYLLDYLKFSCLIDNSKIKAHLPHDFFRFNIKDTLNLIKLGQ